MIVVVVAATEDEVRDVRVRVAQLGAADSQVAAPSDSRRLVLATFADDTAAERAAAALRVSGQDAVLRPDGGTRLEAWMRHTRPITFGDRVSVCFAFSEHDRRDLPGLVELGTGGFGNGAHPTTSLLIGELLARVRGGERVLDVGCGSGVLGLCALRIGASHVVATDLKAEAVDATRRNAQRNDVTPQLCATRAPLDAMAGGFDIVLANVGRGAIVDLAPHLIRLLDQGGWLAVSGFSPAQCSLVAGHLAPLVERARCTSGDWAAMVLAKGS